MGSGTARRVVFGIGRLGKFCCVELGPGSARTGKVRYGRHGELRKVCSGQPRRGTVWYGRQCEACCVSVRSVAAQYGRRGAILQGTLSQALETQGFIGQARLCVLVYVEFRLGLHGRHGGLSKFQVSRGTKRSVPVRQARLVRAIEDSYGESRLGRAGTEPERRKHFGLSIQITWIVPGQCTDRW